MRHNRVHEGSSSAGDFGTGGNEMLRVSQFTLSGDARKGRRPLLAGAAPPSVALPLYEGFVEAVTLRGIRVQTGEFGADESVEIVNDGLVTLIVETPTPLK